MRGIFVGFGEVAEKAHAPVWRSRPGVSMVAAAEASGARRAAAERIFPGIRTCASLDELLASGIEADFADIATPPHLHAAQASACLKRGLHVLCEKPLVLSSEELEGLAREAETARRALFTVHNWKYAPLFQKLKELVDEGKLGAVRHAEWHVLRSVPAAVAAGAAANWRTDPKRAGGGILVDHGWHAAYLLAWLLGAAPKRVHGALKGAGRGRAEREATCLLEFPKATALLHLTWEAPRRDHWGVVYGRAGTAEIRDDRLVLLEDGHPPQTFRFPERLSHGSAHPDWFAAMLGEFEAATRDPAARAQNLLEARACARTIEAVYGAAAKPAARAKA